VVDKLQLSGNASSALAADSSTGSAVNAPGELLAGDLQLFVDNTAGNLTADELARIADAVGILNAALQPYSVQVSLVSDQALANEVLNVSPNSAAGSYADGVLGSQSSGVITIVQGWDWYAGSAPSAIGAGQYDFETAVVHEIGHALGLGHSGDASSVMFAALAAGTARRQMTANDLGGGHPPGCGCPACTGALHAARVAPSLGNGLAVVAPSRPGRPERVGHTPGPCCPPRLRRRATVSSWKAASSRRCCRPRHSGQPRTPPLWPAPRATAMCCSPPLRPRAVEQTPGGRAAV